MPERKMSTEYLRRLEALYSKSDRNDPSTLYSTVGLINERAISKLLIINDIVEAGLIDNLASETLKNIIKSVIDDLYDSDFTVYACHDAHLHKMGVNAAAE